MTAQGLLFTRLRRALDHGNLVEALSAASEMEHVGLVEALELCLLIAEKKPAKSERAVLRWNARYCAETGNVTGGQAQAVLSLLLLIAGKRARESAAALAHLMVAGQAQLRAGEVLLGWSEMRGRRLRAEG